MNEKIKLGVFSGLIFITTLLTIFFAYASGINDLNPLSSGILEEIQLLLTSIPFILFVIFVPLPFTIISIACFTFKDKFYSYATGLIGGILTLIISIFLFGFGAGEIIIAIFFLLSIMLFVETLYVRKKELKTLIVFRATSEATKKAMLIIALSIFVATAISAIENNEQNIEVFGESVMNLAFANNTDNAEPIENIAELLIVNQQQTVTTITNSEVFEKIKEKEDVDVQSFILTMNNLEESVYSNETREQVISQLQENQKNNQNIITFDYLRETSPAINTIAEYYWLITAFTSATFFMFFANIIVSNIAGIYASILLQLSRFIEKKPEEKEE